MKTAATLTSRIEEALLVRNDILEAFFSQEARKLAEASREMSERGLQPG
jgi:D-sedoheptulose 7-phosphate isomerase